MISVRVRGIWYVPTRINVALACLLLASGCTSNAIERGNGLLPMSGSSDVALVQAGNKTAGFRLVPAPLETATRTKRKLPFSLLAPASEQARIVDEVRSVVRAAPPGGTITELQMSPNGKRVLLNFGDSNYSIAAADTLQDLLALPKHPPIEDDVTGFRWFFLDNNFLFGSSALRATDTEGRMASEIDSLPPRAMLLYLYDLGRRTLIPVRTDDRLPQVFSIHDVHGWNITLLTDDSELVGATISDPSE